MQSEKEKSMNELLQRIEQASTRADTFFGASSEYAEFVRSLKEDYQKQVERLDALEMQERAQGKIMDKPKNVYTLADYRKSTSVQTDLRGPKKSALNFPFVIEALTPEDAFCMAVNIHELSGRYAFMTIENLDESTFNSREDFEALGPMTIYIADIHELDLNLQNKLANCLTDRQSERIPQIILGISESITNLKKSDLVDQNLLKKITIGYLHMDQPFASYKNGDLIRFFAESLTARLTLDL